MISCSKKFGIYPALSGAAHTAQSTRAPDKTSDRLTYRNQIHGDQGFAFAGIGRAFLPALLDHDDVGVGLVGIDEMAETLELFFTLDGRLPLTLVGADHVLHVTLEFGADAQFVLDDHLLQVIDAAIQVVQP